MEKPKNKWKIGLSLLIAMVLIVQVAPVLADYSAEMVDASNKTISTDIDNAEPSKVYQPFTNSPIAKAKMEDGQIIPITEPTGDPQPTQYGPCPVGVTRISIDGVWEPEAIATGCYDVDVEVCKLDHICEEIYQCGPAVVKKFLEIYKYHSEEEPDEVVEIFCEDFEDPCTIYENWATIDMPVWGYNGALDTWTWSSKRSCSPDHSMHSTSFDTYLPLQHDILELNMGGAGVDVSAYDEIEVCYNSWVEGDTFDPGDGSTVIQDSGHVEVSLDGGAFTQIGEEQYDSGGECEEICFTLDVTGVSSLMIRFVFTSDEAFCYEGWYVDDVCIYGVLSGSFEEWWELVFSAHSWPQEIVEECEIYVFEPEWCVYQEGLYLICAWIQVLDECHFSVHEYYEPYCIEVEVGDILDISDDAVYTDPSCPVFEGDDLTIYSDICNVGTLDATDVQVQVLVQRGYIAELLNDPITASSEVQIADVGVNPNYFDYWFASAIPGRHNWHVTDTLTPGDYVVANFDEGTMRFLPPGPRTTEWVCPPYMFTGADRNAQPMISFDAAWALPADIANHHWHIGVMDDSSGYLYYFTAPYTGLSNGDGSFVSFEDIEVGGLIQSLYGAGHTTDSDTDLSPIFFQFKTTTATDSGISWSGLMINNLVAKNLIAQEIPIIFEETIIVPWLNVSDCTTVEFVWEDVTVGQYVITEQVLTEDDNMDNNMQRTACNVINIEIELDDPESVDHTWCEDGLWAIEGCCGGYFWAGDFETTTYGNNWDTSLYIAPDDDINMVFAGPLGLTFDTWYQLSANDVGIVEYSQDGGLHWTNIVTFSGTSSDWEAAGPYIIPAGTNQIRFRFVSNETMVNRGWMIDNILIANGGTFFEDECISFDDFENKMTPAGDWWHQYMDTEWFVWQDGQLPGWYTWFPSGYLEPSYGVYDYDYFNLWPYPSFNLFPDGIDCSLIFEFDVPKAFLGWIEKTVYYDLLNDPNMSGTFEISIDGGENWEVLEQYIGSANGDYYAGGLPLWIVVDADFQYWDGNSVTITDYLTVDTIMVRFHMTSSAWPLQPYAVTGFGPLTDGFPFAFYGMYEENPPFTTIEMQGTFDETYGYYTSEVAVWLTAVDDIVGVAATYYELDGTQYTYTGPFIIDGDGEHTLCYWSVDNEGNVEAKKCVPPFKIDQSGPTGVGISILDGPGIYILGFKIPIGDNYIVLFQGVDVTATASVSGAPLKSVEFYMNDQLFSEDTEAPFKATCCMKNQGAATFKVVAKDVLGKSSSASQSVQTYIKLT